LNHPPNQARTVIVGGGAVGCAVAYHLARSGRKDIVLLERSKLSSGTTWHAAGLVRRLRPSATLTRLINDSIDLYAELEAETGQQTGWVETGSLSLATTDDRLVNLKRQISLGRAFGLESEVVDKDRAKDLWPLIETDDVIAAVWSPADGRVNPSDLTQAYVKGARSRGVRFFEDTPVTGFEKGRGRIRAVRTEHARIECEEVVIASGLWSREVAALAGVNMPLYACEHYYLLTAPIEGIEGHLPTLNDHESYLYARDDVGGLLVGCFEPNAKAIALEDLPKDFSFDLLNPDWEHFGPIIQGAIKRIPSLETAEVRTLLNGPESFTLDGQFMMGESPEVDGLFVLGGMNSTGIGLSGGVGGALAEWIIAGEPTMDLSDADIRRFAPEQNVLNALVERIPEVLGRHYELVYPGRQMASARGQRRTTFHAALAQAGARFNGHNGWERAEYFAPGENAEAWPLSFGVPAWRDCVGREHQAALESAILVDQSAYGKILMQGPDVVRFLNRVCANQIDVGTGRIVYTGILNSGAGYESDLTVHRWGDEQYLLVVGAGDVVRVMTHLRRAQFDDEIVTCTDVTNAWSILGLAGPKSKPILEAAMGRELPAMDRFACVAIDLGVAGAFAARLSYTGEEGFEIYVSNDMAMAAYEALLAVGAEHGLRHAGLFAIASLRIEAGNRAFGHELTPAVTPVEAGLDRFADMAKRSPFTGQRSLARQQAGGVSRRIVSLLFDEAEALPLNDEPVYYQGEVVGQVTSAAWSYRFGRSAALALLAGPLEALQAATVVEGFEVEIACERFTARGSLQSVRRAFATVEEQSQAQALGSPSVVSEEEPGRDP